MSQKTHQTAAELSKSEPHLGIHVKQLSNFWPLHLYKKGWIRVVENLVKLKGLYLANVPNCIPAYVLCSCSLSRLSTWEQMTVTSIATLCFSCRDVSIFITCFKSQTKQTLQELSNKIPGYFSSCCCFEPENYSNLLKLVGWKYVAVRRSLYVSTMAWWRHTSV